MSERVGFSADLMTDLYLPNISLTETLLRLNETPTPYVVGVLRQIRDTVGRTLERYQSEVASGADNDNFPYRDIREYIGQVDWPAIAERVRIAPSNLSVGDLFCVVDSGLVAPSANFPDALRGRIFEAELTETSVIPILNQGNVPFNWFNFFARRNYLPKPKDFSASAIRALYAERFHHQIWFLGGFTGKATCTVNNVLTYGGRDLHLPLTAFHNYTAVGVIEHPLSDNLEERSITDLSLTLTLVYSKVWERSSLDAIKDYEKRVRSWQSRAPAREVTVAIRNHPHSVFDIRTLTQYVY